MQTSKTPIETKIDGYGTFKIRGLKAREAMIFQALPDDQYIFATLAATVTDAEGKVTFPSPEAVAEADSVLVRQLRRAYLQLNNLSVDQASGK